MHKKYFFFDIDGTLSTGLTTMMPESAVKALAQLRANGHFTAIATGRLQASAAAVAARYGFTDIVADGGWSVTHNGEIVEMESLPAAEILNQIVSLPERDRLTNLVFMGMGEPLDNLDNLLPALEVLTSAWGIRLVAHTNHGFDRRCSLPTRTISGGDPGAFGREPAQPLSATNGPKSCP